MGKKLGVDIVWIRVREKKKKKTLFMILSSLIHISEHVPIKKKKNHF